MNREGLVEAFATEQAAGPARTVIGLTDEGRSALGAQIRQALAFEHVIARLHFELDWMNALMTGDGNREEG